MDYPRDIIRRAREHRARTVTARQSAAERIPAPAPLGAGPVPPAQAQAYPAAPVRSAPPAFPDSPPSPASVAPAFPAQATPPSPPPAQPSPAPARALTTARPAGSHALYSAIMKRHDRMGTRHL